MLKTLGIDGAIMAIVQDVVKKSESDPCILNKFMGELTTSHDGIPPHKISILALKSVYPIDIPDDNRAAFRPLINELLERHVGEPYRGVLVLGVDTDIGFLELLAQVGANRVKILTQMEYPVAVAQHLGR